MKIPLTLAWVVLLLAASRLTAAPAAGTAPDLVVEVLPSSLAVPAKGDAEVLLVFRNPSPENLRNLRLSWIRHAGVEIATDSQSLPDLAPYEAAARTLRLSRAPQGPLGGAVYLRVDYTWARAERAAPRVAVATLTLTPQEPDSVEQVASLEVKTTAGPIVEYRPGKLYLIVTNTSKTPIDLVSVTPRGRPEFVGLTPIEPLQRKGLLPRDIYVIPYQVNAKGRIRPGKHLLLFQATLEWQRGGRPASGSLVATQEIEVGVLGESEVLTALGVPTFLVLPGFLMMVTFALLWKHASSRGLPEGRTFPIEAKSAEFWLIAVTLSILTAFLYPRITARLGERRSYLEGYDLVDVIRVWTASIAAAALFYLAISALAAWRAARKSALVPASSDTPIELLRKLHRQGLKVYRPQVNVKIGGQGETRRAFLLQPNDGRARIWIGPPIGLVGLDQADPDFKRKVEEQMDPKGGGDPGELADLLEEAQEKVRVDWKAKEGIPRPLEVATADIQGKELVANSLVELVDEE
ncbi:MAG TPA: hypothetical protein VLT87_16640 [Thermoanaerobaculia bacterium]|nr:hypothetical protein [Thermoanaerobaculia bacterium]